MPPTERTRTLIPFGQAPGKNPLVMSIKARFGLVAGVLVLAFLATLLWLRGMERDRLAEMVRQAQAEAARQVGRLLDLDGYALRQLARDAGSGELSAWLAADARAVPLQEKLRDIAAAHGADTLWLLDAAGRIEAGTPYRGDWRPAAPTDRTTARFFAETSAGLMEVQVAARPAAEGGWVVAGRIWNATRLVELGQVTECTAALVEPGTPAAVLDEGSNAALVLTRVLADDQGRPVRQLRLTRPAAEIAGALHTDAAMARLFVGFGLLLLAALGLALSHWVLRPMDRLGESLAQGRAEPIRGMADQGDEFARLARLAETSFAQQAELRREITERKRAEEDLKSAQDDLRQSIEVRSRLARNLHDTVIQSIYATGLGLESARSEITEDPKAAAERLGVCRANLNDTIREVRNFINDLEPESLRRQAFAQALRSLAYTMQSLWVANIALELDEALASRFSAAQETHTLQIVREAISNALRHGEASRVRILLQSDSDGRNALLKVHDNGHGFDAAQRTGTGHGLVNMASRAKEMDGSLRLQTEPGGGTTLVLRVPLQPAGR